MKLDQIRADCRKKLQRAGSKTVQDSHEIIDDSYNIYYTGGYPNVYDRTGALRGSKKVTGPHGGRDSIELEAGYDGGQISYDTGTFSGEQVFEATAEGTYGVKGNPAYDERALEEIKNAANKNFGAEFS